MLHQVGGQDGIEALGDVGFDEVDFVLAAFEFEILIEFLYEGLILVAYLMRLDFDPIARFQINEFVGAVVKGKFCFGAAVGNVEEQYLVHVVLEVLQG